jgi:hypothetical protein
VNLAVSAFGEPYPVDPGCLPPTPRAIAWNRKARLLRTAVIAGLMLGPNAILLGGWFSAEDLRELEARGRVANGQIKETTIRHHRRSREYVVTYSYELNGRDYRRTVSVSPGEYARHSRGKPCEVTYLPDRPDVSYPGDPGPPLGRHNETTVVFATMAAIGLAIWLARVVYVLRRERFLAREGEPIVGKVTDRGEERRKQQTVYYVYHEFRSPAEQTVTSRDYVPRSLYEILRPGQRVTVLYDPANPNRHLPLYAFKYAYIRHDEDSVDDARTEEDVSPS